MSLNKPPGVSHETPVPYRSSACSVGKHSACAQTSPTASLVDVPLIYETCGCECHSLASGGSAPEVPR
ncbi:hypothetical protein K377_03880 [Streptomyces sp. PsTaAH-137]|nr:hypothetical protein K377_03880 [Streptomyces sp. PsTaAH-137]